MAKPRLSQIEGRGGGEMRGRVPRDSRGQQPNFRKHEGEGKYIYTKKFPEFSNLRKVDIRYNFSVSFFISIHDSSRDQFQYLTYFENENL